MDIKKDIFSEMSETITKQLLMPLLKKYTKINFDHTDYVLSLDLSDDKISLIIVPRSDYGEFALKKIRETYISEEIKKG